MNQVRVYNPEQGYWLPNGTGFTKDKGKAWVMSKERGERAISVYSIIWLQLEPVQPGDTPLKFAVGSTVCITPMMHPRTGHTGTVERITLDKQGVRYYVTGDGWGTEAGERELKAA